MNKLSETNNSFGVYVHWPFCLMKCPYCDFNSYKLEEYDEKKWIDAYLNQLNIIKELFDFHSIQKNEICSIYFGGGTPSLMNPYFVEKIIDRISNIFNFNENIEITLEANPSSVEFKNIVEFKKAGINRISVGVQSLNDKNLNFLGRTHNFCDVKKTLKLVNKHFENFSVDLIYGLPKQKLRDWKTELQDFVVSYDLKHLSVYQLTIEQGTKFFNLYKKNKLQTLPEKKSLDLYNVTLDILENKNFIHYEVSNFSKKDYESVHNLLYWTSENWFGIGPGAIGRMWNINNKRFEFENFKKPSTWLNKTLKNGKNFKNQQILETVITDKEQLIMGLRLKKGIKIKKLRNSKIVHKNYFKHLLQNNVLMIKKNNLIVNKAHFHNLDYILRRLINNY